MLLTFRKKKLEDICKIITDGSHHSPLTVEHGKPIASVKDMLDYDIDLKSCRKISDDDYEALVKGKCKPQINDVLIAKDGSFLKKSFVVEADPEYVLLSSIGILRPNTDIVNPYYLMYNFHLDSFKRYVANGFVSGTALKRIVLDAFKRIKINVPPIDVQDEVVRKIKPLDEKVKVNRKLIAELKEYIQLLYHKWFINFDFPDENGNPYKEHGGKMKMVEGKKIPDRWSVDFLTCLGEIVSGGTPLTSNKSYFGENGIPWITPKDLASTDNKYISRGEFDITESGLKNSSAQLMPKGAILMSSRAPIGYLAIAKNQITTNQGFKSIVPNSEIGSEFVYYTLKRYMPKINIVGSGSTFKEVSAAVLSRLKIVKPEREILKAFQQTIHPYSEKIKLIEEENELLVEARGLLIRQLIK